MRCRGVAGAAAILPLLTALLAGAALASKIAEEVRRDIPMGLFGRQQSPDFQRFSDAMGGQRASQIVFNDGSDAKERPFMISGGRSDGSTFEGTQTTFEAASDRVCDDQKNDCADQSNRGDASFKVSDCDAQNRDCKTTNQPTDQDDEFLYFCD
ncbi:hypothetical protein GGS23DRAFT_221310 [Durotheca rogersii]|uniref:uncharacterized protein n=1 Tax=Durotheca rogersii TaxID=419775 RepID=UPI00221F22BD|nr:uncharacterized protein GGS23DRAFT_221310 [Durotheca rogersii]KAI5860698.1 hypothetical protein GGS23DRAFT_221310 [Durotheca rogersii]